MPDRENMVCNNGNDGINILVTEGQRGKVICIQPHISVQLTEYNK